MNTHPRSHVTATLLAALCVIAPPSAAAQARRSPVAAQKAGSITALLPTAKVLRGPGKHLQTLEAKRGDEVFWEDVVRTEKGGRARITLNDQSILSVGSQSELRIVKHDARSQQTTLQLGYGRVRSQVVGVTRDGGRFQLRTPTAVAGVIGTDFGVTETIGAATFVCISGLVNIANADPNVSGSVNCPAGSYTTVTTGNAPTVPQPATQEQIEELIRETEPAIITGLAPNTVLAGQTTDMAASGQRMGGINAVQVDGAKVSAAINPGATDTAVSVKIVAAPDAPAGPRTVTFSKPNGQNVAAVFTVIAAPADGDANALKDAYLKVFEQERQSAIAGLNALTAGVQQSADQASQQIVQASANLSEPRNLNETNEQLSGPVQGIQNATRASGTAINEAAQNATKAFAAAFDAAYQVLLGRNSGGVPDDAFKQAALAAFNEQNAAMIESFSATQQGLGQQALQLNASIQAITERILGEISQLAAQQQVRPVPQVDAEDKSVVLGSELVFDASRSRSAAAGATITGYQWVLCDASYKPQQVGVLLPENAPACTPVPGFTSTASEFKVESCSLTPNEYIARLAVTDSNNRRSSMDVRMRVQAPSYDDPSVTLRNLAVAYTNLQPSQFLDFFDSSFPGLTQLQENIRNTFVALNTMNINLRISQANVDCNNATVRADWDQIYTFKQDGACTAGASCERTVFRQNAQLSARMKRDPQRGWLITDFQGDNGTVQGVPPGPQVVDSAQPDLRVTSIMLGNQSGASLIASGASSALRRASGFGKALVADTLGIPAGPNAVTATVTNVGNADATQPVTVRLSVRSSSLSELSFVDVTVPGPIARDGGTIAATGTLNVPSLAPGTTFVITANANPGCVAPERNCDGANLSQVDAVLGGSDLAVGAIQPVGTITGTQTAMVNVTITNSGISASLPSSGTILLLSGTTALAGVPLPVVPAGGSVVVPITFTAPNAVSSNPQFNLQLTVQIQGATGETNTSNNSATNTVPAVTGFTDLVAAGLSTVNQPPFVTGTQQQVNFSFRNAGNITTGANVSYTCRLLFGSNSTILGSGAIPPVVAGGTAAFNVAFTIPASAAGQDTIECSATQDVNEPVALIANNAASIPVQIDLAFTDLTKISLAIVSQPPFISGMPIQLRLSAANAGNIATAANAPFTCETTLFDGAGSAVLGTGTLPSIAPNSAVNLDLTFALPKEAEGFNTIDCAVGPDAREPVNLQGDNAAKVSAEIDLGFTDLEAISLQLQTQPPYETGQTVQLVFAARNRGNIPSSDKLPFSCKTTFEGGSFVLFNDSLAVILPGVGLESFFGVQLPANASGQNTLECAIAPDLAEPANRQGNNAATVSLDVAQAGFVDFAVSNLTLTNPPPFFPGQLQSVEFTLSNKGTLGAAGSYQCEFLRGTQAIPFPPVAQFPALGPNASLQLGISQFRVPEEASGADSLRCRVRADIPEPQDRLADNQIVTAARVFEPVVFENLSHPNNNASDPLVLPVGGGSQLQVRLRLRGNWDTGPAFLTLPQIAGITVFPELSTVDPNSDVLLTIFASQGAPSTVTAIPIRANIPGTTPPVFAETSIFVLPDEVPDLQVVSAQPVIARDFASSPWLSGEVIEWEVLIRNNGTRASSPGLLKTFLDDEYETPLLSIAPQTQVAVRVRVAGSDFMSSNSFLEFFIDPCDRFERRCELISDNNFLSFTVNGSDWGLAPGGQSVGSAASPLVLSPTALPASGRVTINIVDSVFGDTGQGARVAVTTPIQIVKGISSTGIEGILAVQQVQGTGPSFDVDITAQPGLLAGDYLFQVIGEMRDGSVATTRRQVTVHIRIEATATQPAIALELPRGADIDNPLQVNGTIPEDVEMTPFRPNCTPGSTGNCAGTVDVHITNTASFDSITAAPEQFKAVPIDDTGRGAKLTTTVQATAVDSGSVALGTFAFEVSLSAQKVGVSAFRIAPTPDPLGTPIPFFVRAGDLGIFNGDFCVGVPINGGTFNDILDFVPDNGFNAQTLEWEVLSAPPGLTVAPSSGTVSYNGADYGAPISLTYTNNNTVATDFGLIQLRVRAINANGRSAEKFTEYEVGMGFDCGGQRVSANGATGRNKLKATWGRLPGTPAVSASRLLKSSLAGAPDLQFVASETRYTPSIPKNGDTVDVRFKISNLGDTDARAVPIVLRVNGAIVASDTFDLAKGASSLGGLQWKNAQKPAADTIAAELVIDPAGTIKQKSPASKTVALAKFSMREGAALPGGGYAASGERVYIEVSEDGCTGFRLSSGSGAACDTADAVFTVNDLGNNNFSLSAVYGAADLGMIAQSVSAKGAQYNSDVTLQTGHAYAVKVGNGQIGYITVQAVANPNQLDAKVRKVFRNGARRMIERMAGSGKMAETGDVSGIDRSASVFLDVLFRTE